MENLRDILKKVETPLDFLSKDSFKNITLVRDFESSMVGLLNKLKSVAAPFLWDESSRVTFNGIIEHLERTFSDFDILEPVDKRERVTTARQLIRQIHTLPLEPPQGDIPGAVCAEKLTRPVQYVKGVGPKIAQLLAKKNLTTVEDLLYFLPRRYEDRRFITTVSSAEAGAQETIIGTVINARMQYYRRTRIFEVTFDDGTGVLTAKWFHGNFTYLRKTFQKGTRYIVTGEVKSYLLGKDMIHPDYEKLDEKDDDMLHFKRIVPVYSETAGLHQKYIRKVMMHAVSEYADYILSPIPGEVCGRQNLPDMHSSLQNVHFPDNEQDINVYNGLKSLPHRRIIFDELFFFELAMAVKKKGYVLERGITFTTGGPTVSRFIRSLHFTLTGAQRRVISEIETDMRADFSMNRLLQGDVGSGKTVVAMVAMVTACENGFQSAIMAPTEILAEQHFTTIAAWAETIGLRVALLTGSMKEKERKHRLQGIERGDVNIVVGTHALIQGDVTFNNLGFVVIDEQHRFGVIQRSVLREKGMTPDVLVMTATPIPRTLAMTVYGDLDFSVIDEVPPGKIPIKTKVFNDTDRHKVYDIIRKEVAAGNQTFIVYPLVEESDTLDLKDATTMAKHLKEDIFPEFSVGLIHGKMKSNEKNEIMGNFSKKSLNILVATTVIEVGIDIPSASLMIIEHAERFGLSQLHQLRGRVGRSDLPSYCVLIAHHYGTEDARRRLRIMEQTNDGFRIAEEDLAIRGPGDFMGTRQSGLPDFRVANILRDAAILNEARREAFIVVQGDPSLDDPEHALLKEELQRRWAGRLDLAKTG